MNKHIIEVDSNKCVGCELCVHDCPVNNINISENKACIYKQNCLKCGHCVAICPKNAVKMTGFEEMPEDIKEFQTLNSDILMDALKQKRSFRQFKNQDISAEIIERIIEAGRMTPTAKNTQDVSYIVLQKDIAKYEEIAVNFFRRLIPLAKLFNESARHINIDNHFFFKKAPVAIVVVSKTSINGALAASNMALMAESYGLGVLYSGFFSIVSQYSRKLRKEFQLNRKDKVITTLVIGYPAVHYYRTTQKEKAKVLHL